MVKSNNTKRCLKRVVDESLEKTRPGVISLEGSWGCGKSYLLNDLLNEWVNTVDDPFRIVATYNAWEDDVGEKPIIPVLFRLARELDDVIVEKNPEVGTKRIRSFSKMFFDLLGVIPYVGTAARNFGHDLIEWRKEKESIERSNLPSNNEQLAQAKSWSDLYKELGDLCDCGSAKNYKIILVVDDLDRIMPQRQMALLESLYHLAESMRVLVIVAFDPNQLTETIESFFGENTDVSKYLDKIFASRVVFEETPNQKLLEDISEMMNCLVGKGIRFRPENVQAITEPFDLSARNLRKIEQELRYIADTHNRRPLTSLCALELLISLVFWRNGGAEKLLTGEDSADQRKRRNDFLQRVKITAGAIGIKDSGCVTLEEDITAFFDGKGFELPDWVHRLKTCSYHSLDAHISIKRKPVYAEDSDDDSDEKASAQ